MTRTMSRRDLLKVGAIATGGLLAACAPKVVKETVVVEKVVEKPVEKVVKETVIVQGTPQVVEKVVKETVVVEKDVAAEKAARIKGKLVWDTFRGIGTGWNEERISTFKDMYPNVDIEFRPTVVSSQQEAYGKWYAMQAAGDLGDIVQFDPSHFHFWRAIDKGILMPLDELMAADGLNLKEWFDQFIEMQYYKGKIYGLPSWGWSGHDAFVINVLHCEELGITPPEPTTHEIPMETIAEWANKFYKKGAGPGEVERYGIALSIAEIGITTIVRAFGGEIINPEGTKCLLLEEGAVKGMKWMYDLCVTQAVAALPGDLQGGNQSAWAAGKLTMMQVGSLSALNAEKAITDPKLAQLGHFFFPKRPDGKIPSQIRGGTWGVNKATKAPEAAYLFVKHLAGKEGTIGFNLVGNNGALTRPDVLPVLEAKNKIYGWYKENLLNGMAIHAPANSRGREYTDAIGQWAVKMLDRKQPVPFEQGLQELADNVQKALDEPPA
ncbi:MAG: extracellular solute-binding protein [Chloroflexi bacterium]|nr:extracellular solute-binding protein [Chloroflexota bacterium]